MRRADRPRRGVRPSAAEALASAAEALPTAAERNLFPVSHGDRPMITALRHPLFWNMKIKIAILTLATYLAMC